MGDTAPWSISLSSGMVSVAAMLILVVCFSPAAEHAGMFVLWEIWRGT